MAQEGAQRRGEGDAGRLVHLGLVDGVEDVLDRVLDGQHLAVAGRQAPQRCVERRGLAAAGRPGDQDEAERAAQLHLERLHQSRLEPEARQGEVDALAGQDAQDGELAVDGWRRRDAQVGRPAAHLQRRPAVLRRAGRGDVEVGQHLGPGDHPGPERGAERLQIAQGAVDPHAHHAAPALLLEVQVGGALGDRPGQHAVEVAHHRRVAGEVPEPLGVGQALGVAVRRHRQAVVARRAPLVERDGAELHRAAERVGDPAPQLRRAGIDQADDAALRPVGQDHRVVLGEELGVQSGRQGDRRFRGRSVPERRVVERRRRRGDLPVRGEAQQAGGHRRAPRRALHRATPDVRPAKRPVSAPAPAFRRRRGRPWPG